MKQKTKENPNEERYIATREIIDFDLLHYLRTDVMPLIEELVELKNVAYYDTKKDFEEHRNVCVNLLNGLAESLKQGAQNLEEFT